MIKVEKLQNIPDDVWIYNNFVDNKVHKTVTMWLQQNKDQPINIYSGKTILENGRQLKISGSTGAHRYQQFWYLPQIEGYWNQTNSTIKSWAETQYKKYIPPVLRFLCDKILSVKPFVDSKEDWIAIRCVFNIMPKDVDLHPHIDGMYYIMDNQKYSTYSAIYYCDVDGNGGEYWDQRGFLHKPQNNSLMITDGSRWYHGVRPMDKERLALVIRFVRIQDLTLPGSVDKLLYAPIL